MLKLIIGILFGFLAGIVFSCYVFGKDRSQGTLYYGYADDKMWLGLKLDEGAQQQLPSQKEITFRIEEGRKNNSPSNENKEENSHE